MSSSHILYTNRDIESEHDYVEKLFNAYPHIRKDFFIFLYRHSSVNEITTILEKVDFSNLEYVPKELSTKEILRLDNLFPEFVDDTALNPIYHIEKFKTVFPQVTTYWDTCGSWMIPIIVYFPKLNSPTLLTNKIVLEGHTRLGILKGLLTLKDPSYVPRDIHYIHALIEK